MNRYRWAIPLVVAFISLAICACATQTESDYYVLSYDDATQLSVDAVSDRDEPPSVRLRVDCETPEDGEGEAVCDEIEIARGMPIELWRQNWRPLELSVFEFAIDGGVIYDLDGEPIGQVSEVDLFALQTSTMIKGRNSRLDLKKGWFVAGFVAVPLLGFLILLQIPITPML